ncbi:MAG: DUF58 domain-containing protein [Candidatus Binatia bacterium]
MVVARLKERFSALRHGGVAEDPFDPEFFARLDRIRIRFGHAHGRRAGETPVRGLTQDSGIEIESFKSYAPGDDIRYVDWNAVGRLDQLLTRRFVAEREIPVHVLLDASGSMAAPAADRKFLFGVRLAAALAYIALNNNEPVRITTLRTDGSGPLLQESPLLRHHGRYPALKPFLAGLAASGGTALADGARAYVERHGEGGMAFLVSDFLVDDPVYEDALTRLRAKRLDVSAVHVIGRRERDPEGLRGRLRLRDAETGAFRDVTLGEADRRRYRDDFEERVARLRRFCHRSGIGHAVAFAEHGVERNLVAGFATQGMLRLR